MKKTTYLKQIQKRLPEKIVLRDETTFEFTDDEYVGILSWLKYFRSHYDEYGKESLPKVTFPIISQRLRLDFGLYHIPCDLELDKGEHVVYISDNRKLSGGAINKKLSVKDLINTWQL